MKVLISVALLAPLGFAGIPSNAVYLTNNTGSTVNQPYIISRFFAQGEIRNYPKPSGISQWQSEVKTRWPDGTVQHALIAFWKSTANASFPNADTDTISFANDVNPCHLGNATTCTNAGLEASGMLNFNSGNWGAAIQATQVGITYATDARMLIGSGKIQLYWMRGPIVTVAVVEDRTPGTGGGTPDTDFGWKCASVYRYTVDTTTDTLTTYDSATGSIPTNHGFVAGQKINLGATTTGPAPYTAKLKAGVFALTPSGFTLKISATNGGTAVDFTTTGTGNLYVSGCGGNTDYSNASWTPDTTYRPLHPQFILTFFRGWPGVYEEFVMQNMWVSAMQDQRYDLVLKNGASNANTVVSNTVTQFARGEWVYRAWDGTATTTEFPTTGDVFKPGVSTYAGYTAPNFKINLNTQYLLYSKMLPQLDPSLTVDASSGSVNTKNDITFFATQADPENPFRCTTTTYCREFTANMMATGGRPELSLLPRWIGRYVYSWDPRLFLVSVGNGDIVGTIPYHHMESTDRGNTFDSAHTVSTFGRLLSVNSRPTARIFSGGANIMDNSGSGSDPIQYVDSFPAGVTTTRGYSFSDGYKWIPDYSWGDGEHQAAYHFWPYMLTGDYFYLEDGWAYTEQYLFEAGSSFRHSDWGLVASPAMRGYAWPWRNMVMMSVMTPDGWPEKDYFTEKANNHISFFEAVTNLKPGQGYYATSCNADTFNFATETNKFCWLLLGKFGYSPGHNVLNMATLQSAGASLTDPSIPSNTRTVSNIYMSEYLQQALGWAADLGWQTDKLLKYTTRFLTELALSAYPDEAERYVFPLTYAQPTNTLQSSITTTDRTITLTAPLAIGIDPPFAIAIHLPTVTNCNTTSNCEWVYICSVDSTKTILTVCSTGRGALKGSSMGAGSPAKAHSAGDIVDIDSQMPLIHSFAGWQAAITPSYRYRALPLKNLSDTSDGFAHLAIVGLSFGDGSYQAGKNAFDAYTLLAGYRDNPATNNGYNYAMTDGGYNPQLRYKPRREPVLNVRTEVGDTFVILRWTAPSAGKSDSACAVSTDGGATWALDGQSGRRERWYVVTGLTASTSYTSTPALIHCDADYYDTGAGSGNTAVSYTTRSAFSGMAALASRLGPGPATAYLDYGSTASLGTTTSASCTSGCSLSATVARGLLYYRTRRSDGNAGAATPIIVQ